jgi:BspA type Leucine rich repeat region (6 copies)/Secretion system C-terminal sorting domain
MKFFLSILIFSVFVYSLEAQVTKTIDVTTAGTLSTLLSANEKANVTNLTITGNIDARDIKCVRDEITSLVDLDLSKVTIQAYSGSLGTVNTSTSYNANMMPQNSFSYATFTYYVGNTSYKSKINLSSVKLPTSLMSIGDNAFYQCIGLTNVTIPTTINSIGNSAFSGCIKIKNVELTNAITTIGKSAFYNCNLLESITIPSSITLIDDYTFYQCTKLNKVTIPSSVFSIGKNSFEQSGISELIMSDGLNSIGNSAFSDCYKLVNVLIPNTVKSIGGYAFSQCLSLQSINFPNSISLISDLIFQNCSSLSTISIPASVTMIGNSSFSGCKGLQSILSYSMLPINLFASANVFKSVDKTICKLYVPIGSISLYQLAEQWKDFTNIVEMTTAVPTLINQNISIFPNPVSENFTVSGFNGISTIILTDVNGKIVLSKKISTSEMISTSALPKGLYAAKIYTSEGNAIRKIMKE